MVKRKSVYLTPEEVKNAIDHSAMSICNSNVVCSVFFSVQFSFISAPPHEQNNKMLKSLCVVKDWVRKRKKLINSLLEEICINSV